MHKLTQCSLAAAAAALALLGGCATNPVTGKSDIALMSEDSEVKLGKQMHVQITQSMGVYDDYNMQDYVQRARSWPRPATGRTSTGSSRSWTPTT